MTDPHEQTVYYVAVMLWTESELADLEKEIPDISSINSLHWRKLQQKGDKHVEISSRVHRFQKTTSEPDSHLHKLIEIDQDDVGKKLSKRL